MGRIRAYFSMYNGGKRDYTTSFYSFPVEEEDGGGNSMDSAISLSLICETTILPMHSTTVGLGSALYSIGGRSRPDRKPLRDVYCFDTINPPMTGVNCKESEEDKILNRKMNMDHWAECYDPSTDVWEPVEACRHDGIYGCLASFLADENDPDVLRFTVFKRSWNEIVICTYKGRFVYHVRDHTLDYMEKNWYLSCLTNSVTW